MLWLIFVITTLYVLWVTCGDKVRRILLSPGRWPADVDVRLERNREGVLEISIYAPDPRMADQLVRHLRKRYAARVTYHLVSPTGEMIWRLDIEGQSIEVLWEEWGEDLTVFALDPRGESIVEQIAASIQDDLKEPVKEH